jgi:hypothetical protein
MAGTQRYRNRARDLACILYAASAQDAEYVFGDSIVALTQDNKGVEVTFERSRARRFDLIVGGAYQLAAANARRKEFGSFSTGEARL